MPDFCLKGGEVLRSIEIPYGRGRQIFHIEDHRLTGVLMPETMPKAGEETEIVRRAISAPIDSARLSTLSQTAERILLITSDHTRSVPSRITLPLLLEEIREGNSAPKPFELILKITKALRFFEESQGFFLGAPNAYNPNQIFQIGNGFGFFLTFHYDYFENGRRRRASSKCRTR